MPVETTYVRHILVGLWPFCDCVQRLFFAQRNWGVPTCAWVKECSVFHQCSRWKRWIVWWSGSLPFPGTIWLYNLPDMVFVTCQRCIYFLIPFRIIYGNYLDALCSSLFCNPFAMCDAAFGFSTLMEMQPLLWKGHRRWWVAIYSPLQAKRECMLCRESESEKGIESEEKKTRREDYVSAIWLAWCFFLFVCMLISLQLAWQV
jgi:hypothetical protein